MSKWKYYRIPFAKCSKWVLGRHWVTKFDDDEHCVVGFMGARQHGTEFTNFTDPAKAREYVETREQQTTTTP